jgi:hypothetical protein
MPCATEIDNIRLSFNSAENEDFEEPEEELDELDQAEVDQRLRFVREGICVVVEFHFDVRISGWR